MVSLSINNVLFCQVSPENIFLYFLEKMSESFLCSLFRLFEPSPHVPYLLCLKQKPGIRNILYLYLGT